MFNLDQFYDYCLTIRQEVLSCHYHPGDGPSFLLRFQMRYVWETKFTLAGTLFVCSRYPAFLTAILVLLPVRFPRNLSTLFASLIIFKSPSPL